MLRCILIGDGPLPVTSLSKSRKNKLTPEPKNDAAQTWTARAHPGKLERLTSRKTGGLRGDHGLGCDDGDQSTLVPQAMRAP